MENGNASLRVSPPSSSQATAHDATNPPMSPSRMSWKHPLERRQRSASIDLDDYFAGPRDTDKHSKWPFFMRMHGSVFPKMIVPLLFVGGWATMIACISHWVYPLKVASVLLTVLGFVVGLALSFRSSTAYERYTEGRKYWSQLIFTSQNMARIIWVNTKEREGELGKRDLLAKLSTLNLIVAFAIALKHKLRFEPGIVYDDLQPLVQYLDSFAKAAEDHIEKPKNKNTFKITGEYLGVSFAESNPRKYIKRARKPLGNLPLEILKYISSYGNEIIANGTLSVPIYQTHLVNNITTLNEVMVGTERILNTPLPIAYNIAIAQITWVYVLMLPFQLWDTLEWITIPGTIFAAYIILGLAAIGREIENPFGNDVNDLPLEAFCDELALDIDVLTSTPCPEPDEFLASDENLPLYPLSLKGMETWATRSKMEIREALMTKANANLTLRKSMSVNRPSQSSDRDTVKEKEQQHAANDHSAV